jgi:apolipoprotein N-acyltransferase
MTLAQAIALGPAKAVAWPWPLRLAGLASLGAVAGLGQVPTSWPVATLAALILLFALVRRSGPRFLDGWAFGAGHFALSLRWIVEPFLVEPERTGWMAPFALVFMAGGLALFWGAAFGLTRRFRLGSLGLVVLWTGAEVARALAFTGFPWVMLGHVWSETPIVQLASVIGVHGLTLLTLGAAALIASPRAGLWRLVAVAGLGGGAVLLGPGAAPQPEPDAPFVRIVQPNVPQHEKWDPALQPAHLRRLLSLSGPAPGGASDPGRPADLVVWPETALTELLEWAGPTLASGVQAAGGAPLATGVVRQDKQGRYFNSLVVMDEQGTVAGLYDKVHLVPFGEYMPFRGLLSRWGLRAIAEIQGDGFTTGNSEDLIAIPGIGTARPLICYEGIFPEEIGSERPRFLLLVTNDAWFGRRAGPEQHFALGRLRAIELGLPLVRAANTGISAMIDGKGRVLASLPLHEAGALEVPLPSALSPTVYARWGDAPLFMLLVALAAAAFWLRGIDPRSYGA